MLTGSTNSGQQLDSSLSLWLPHVGGLLGCWNTSQISMEVDRKLSARIAGIYYSPRGYWKGLPAIKNLSAAVKVTEQQAKDWLKKQAIWQIYLPAPRPKFDVAVPNEVHQADLLFLPYDRVRRKTFCSALTVVDVASPTRRLSPGLARLRQRSPMARLGFTSGAPCGGRSSFRLTLGASSWVK